MVQAAVLDGLVFDASPFGPNGFATPEVDVSRGQVADALMVATVVVVVDEGGDGGANASRSRTSCDRGQRPHRERGLFRFNLPKLIGPYRKPRLPEITTSLCTRQNCSGFCAPDPAVHSRQCGRT